MKAVILPGDKRVTVVERDIPEPGPHEVLVRTRASAICRSDMSIYYGTPIVGGEGAGHGSVIPGMKASPASNATERRDGASKKSVNTFAQPTPMSGTA